MKIYHYTNIDAIKNILLSGKIWLSDVHFMNDSSEYIEGESLFLEIASSTLSKRDKYEKQLLEIISDVIERRRNGYTFVGSFSTGKDQLSQWLRYSPNQGGYAFEFQVVKSGNYYLFGGNYILHKCIYRTNRKKQSARDVIEKLLNIIYKSESDCISLAQQIVWHAISRYKNIGFEEESEYRNIVFAKGESELNWRTRDSVIFPYVSIPFPYVNLEAIWIGPGPQQNRQKKGLELFLSTLVETEKSELKIMPKIHLSKIPFVI